MKTKRFGKKLTLDKKTIADLNNGAMKGVQCGLKESFFPFGCDVYWTETCFTVCYGSTCATGYPPCEIC
jgi:hypothetical protein